MLTYHGEEPEAVNNTTSVALGTGCLREARDQTLMRTPGTWMLAKSLELRCWCT